MSDARRLTTVAADKGPVRTDREGREDVVTAAVSKGTQRHVKSTAALRSQSQGGSSRSVGARLPVPAPVPGRRYATSGAGVEVDDSVEVQDDIAERAKGRVAALQLDDGNEDEGHVEKNVDDVDAAVAKSLIVPAKGQAKSKPARADAEETSSEGGVRGDEDDDM